MAAGGGQLACIHPDWAITSYPSQLLLLVYCDVFLPRLAQTRLFKRSNLPTHLCCITEKKTKIWREWSSYKTHQCWFMIDRLYPNPSRSSSARTSWGIWAFVTILCVNYLKTFQHKATLEAHKFLSSFWVTAAENWLIIYDLFPFGYVVK